MGGSPEQSVETICLQGSWMHLRKWMCRSLSAPVMLLSHSPDIVHGSKELPGGGTFKGFMHWNRVSSTSKNKNGILITMQESEGEGHITSRSSTCPGVTQTRMGSIEAIGIPSGEGLPGSKRRFCALSERVPL